MASVALAALTWSSLPLLIFALKFALPCLDYIVSEYFNLFGWYELIFGILGSINRLDMIYFLDHKIPNILCAYRYISTK